jgi:DNA-binding transcriptional ArsR family regulator
MSVPRPSDERSLGAPAPEFTGHAGLPPPRSQQERDDERAWEDAESGGHFMIRQWTDILKCLARGPVWVTGIVEELQSDKSSVSHHLGQLRALGLVEFEQRGRDRIFRLTERVSINREDAEIVVGLTVSDLCKLLVFIKDKTTDLSPRVAAVADADAKNDPGAHGRGRTDEALRSEPKPPAARPGAPRRPGPRAK